MNHAKPLNLIIEGALLASENPLSLQDIANLFDENKPSKNEIKKAIDALNNNYKNHSFEIINVASGFRMQVKKGYDNWISKLNKQSSTRYSKAFLETLVIIAYKQPVTRGDIEEIRGVAVNPQIIRNLIEFEWIKVVGHKETPGKPELLATTKKFLDYFNLKSLSDLPPPSELELEA
ncbi:MAG: SMC-Scp complex subunit ScpB [Gammaproteobacteria bacterium]|jgi:segregation and condensation protein B|nr:SMC-Scp complex subunit ScpB [Gammaproteobacteria bacterium]MBT4462783.1 SMC-Scp complex subunit ScpB [Gammaproteobacteria bacterium]MBT4654341.1 SMC-Scp complex subunit ScpB [Gammaproteobacteria bacterium]MBT5117339.1 SMC-Scp complex subunit ScpB [Gammaproteobacteria bacterium]MBT5761910.1 SMC-Scp complex subunit ScpB [Gammaproteobacteria bacterium]